MGLRMRGLRMRGARRVLQTKRLRLAAIAALQVLIFSGCASEPAGEPVQASTQTRAGASPDAQAQATHHAKVDGTFDAVPLLPLLIESGTANQPPSSAASAIANSLALAQNCVAVDRYHSPQSGITEGQWRFKNTCEMGISLTILVPGGQNTAVKL